ncbi:hypothetical protein [Providencia phage PSTCR2]|uniref:Uncharacterized protein n=1 Tax=Providencia phage PSTCR2 TaxID=2783544 RepID=A0A873WRP2_9CAUD|nr:hypothetical protein [Providencia phage PSTCR2]
MVNYGILNNICQQIRSLGFDVRGKTDETRVVGLYYVGFEVDGICSYGCWRSDEQVAVNQAADKLRAVHEALVYWSNKSR